MSALLEAVSAAREARDAAAQAFKRAVREARGAHSLGEIARAAGLSRTGVQHIVREPDEPKT